MKVVASLVVVALLSACSSSSTQLDGVVAEIDGSSRWLKGQLHMHTASHPGRSEETGIDTDDGDWIDTTTVEDMVERYQESGFDFIVLTDHNRTTEFTHAGPMRVYSGIELSQDSDACDPRPHDPTMICRIHVGSLFSDVVASNQIPWGRFSSGSPIRLSEFLISTAQALDGLVMINHPTQFWAVDGRLLWKQFGAGALLVEMANMGIGLDDWNAGTADRPGSEALWDEALSAGALLYGVASDDAHSPDEVGRGWVMVRAENTGDSIRAALESGDFYSSTGVVLARLDLSATRLTVEVDSDEGHLIEFIGRDGLLLLSTFGTAAHYELGSVPSGYVRAVITSPTGEKAWTQPVWLPLP